MHAQWKRKKHCLETKQLFYKYIKFVIMKKIIFVFVAVLLISSCGTCKHFDPVRQVDSVYIEKVVQKVIHDTTYMVQLPDSTSEQKVNQTDTSHLETQLAESDAWLDFDGKLNHSLRNKNTKIPVPVQLECYLETTIKNSLMTNTVIREVEKELTSWQECLLVMGKIFIFVISVVIVVAILLIIKKLRP